MNGTRWVVYVNDKEVPIVGPQLGSASNALQFGLGVSRDNPVARIRVVEVTRLEDGWDGGIDIGQFRDNELLPESDWT